MAISKSAYSFDRRRSMIRRMDSPAVCLAIGLRGNVIRRFESWPMDH